MCNRIRKWKTLGDKEYEDIIICYNGTLITIQKYDEEGTVTLDMFSFFKI